METARQRSPFRFLTTATLTWFDNGCCDVKYLDEWHDVPLSYQPGLANTPEWHFDFQERIIVHDDNGRLFHRAADCLMRYHFYPPHILSPVSTFGLANRWLEIGDRIVQRIHLWSLFSRPILDVLTMTEITQTIVEPHRCGFTYTTVATHVEQGAWSAVVTWRPNGDIVLTLEATSRPSPNEPAHNHAYIRAFQKRAQAASVSYFQQLVTAKPAYSS